jgi:hypothetical protein
MIVLELSKRDLGRINAVDLLVSKFFHTSLYQFCSKYYYDKLFIEIIKQVTEKYDYDRMGYFEIELPDELDDRYYEVEKKFSYGADNRGVAERIISLGVNWVVEDVIVHKSSSVFILTGCDNTRDLLANPITSTPDIRYVGTGESFYVEVCSDFTRFMSKAKRYDIRKLKYMKLEDLLVIDKKKTLLLFIDVVNKTYHRMWFRPQSYAQEGKFSKNTVSFEFEDSVEFKGLSDLFEICKTCQPNPSLYSNFNIETKSKVSKPSVNDTDDDGYWESLFRCAPSYVKTRDISEEEITGVYKEVKDPYESEYPSYPKTDPLPYSEFIELPPDTPTPFDLDMGVEPVEKEEPVFDDRTDEEMERFYNDYYGESPFGGSSCPF